MKALAAVSIRQYEKAVESLADYTRTIELGAQILAREWQDEVAGGRFQARGGLGAVVIGSDQGMCGQFNEEITAYTLASVEEQDANGEKPHVLALGRRVAVRLIDSGQPVDEIFAIPTSVAGITPLVQDVLMKIDEWGTQEGVTRVHIFFNRPQRAATYQPDHLHLLPLDLERLRVVAQRPWPSPVLPTFSMDWQNLLSALVRQYLFISVFRAVAESQASENAARLASMQAAEKNIQEYLEELTTLFHSQRQTSITAELLDIVSGFEVLSG